MSEDLKICLEEKHAKRIEVTLWAVSAMLDDYDPPSPAMAATMAKDCAKEARELSDLIFSAELASDAFDAIENYSNDSNEQDSEPS